MNQYLLQPRDANRWTAILSVCGCNAATAAQWGPIFADTLKPTSFSVGELDLADFLPTILHESQMLAKLKEDGHYSVKRIVELGNASEPGSRWRSLVPIAAQVAMNEPAFFEAIYGGRLGNDKPGDGALYAGRGLIMLTGKDNYIWQGNRSGQDLVGNPTLAEQPHFALEFAIDWWEGKVPDKVLGNQRAVRKIVNGGYFGITEVEALAQKVMRALR